MGITRRHLLRGAALLPVLRGLPIAGQSQASSSALAISGPEGFRVYTDAPRLFLTKARLRLLRRERERRSIRWEAFETLWGADSEFPEFGWTAALRYQIAQEDAAGRQAVSWAVGKAMLPDASVSDGMLRQIALVADWCGPLMSAADKTAILGRLEKVVARPAVSLAEARTKVLAAIVLSESKQAVSEKALREVYEQFWTRTFIVGVRDAKVHVPNADAHAMLELMHAFRDNVSYDLRESFPEWFRDYALIHILAHYPEPFPGAENEYRIPADSELDQRGPDVTKATLSRAAELAMVAFDANANETQLLQGFLMNDRFLMRGTLGISYELMWADPYQPGLSYYHVPLVAHDAVGGELYVRSSWEDDAAWLGFFGGHLQLFANGEVQRVEPEAAHDPMDLDEATVFFAHQRDRFSVPVRKVVAAAPTAVSPAVSAADRADAAAADDSGSGPDEALDDVFIVGLEPRRRYHVEVDHEGMVEAISDPGGIVYLSGLPSGAVVRFEVGLTS